MITEAQAAAFNEGKEAALQEVTDFLGPDAVYWYSTTSSLKKNSKHTPQEIQAEIKDKFASGYRYIYMQNQDQHTTHDPASIDSACDEDTLGKFLLTAEKGMFIGCNGWDERFGLPLGDPTGPMEEQKDGTLFRSFAAGVTVTWNPKAKEGSRASISWPGLTLSV